MVPYWWHRAVRRLSSTPIRRLSKRHAWPFCPHLEIFEDRVLPSTFLVTTSADAGPGSLRQALLDANASPGLDTIAFNIANGGVETIAPRSALPAIADPVLLDGTSQPGYAGTPLIMLTGANAGPNVVGLTISAGGCTIMGLVINGFSGRGMLLQGDGGDVIAGNYIGTDAAGFRAVMNGGDGIALLAPNNTIGGTAAGAGNLVSGNGGNGIYISSNGNLLQGNFIGTDQTGTRALANKGEGVLSMGGTGNTLGGTNPAARNLISGNALGGVGFVAGAANLVQGNFIGTSITGTTPVPNSRGGGVGIGRGSSFNTIGGAAPGAGNLISGNSGELSILADQNLIQGNKIGTDITGTHAIAGSGGIGIGGSHNTIGGTDAGAGNLISGNGYTGISILSVLTENPSNNLVQGNKIGTDITGTRVLSNNGGGVFLGNYTAHNTIGGVIPEARNLISGNLGIGVVLTGDLDAFNVVQGNYIGTDYTGTVSVPNLGGIQVALQRGDTIGGTVAGAGNLISGNQGFGIRITGEAKKTLVAGNWIGTDVSGRKPLQNDGDGVTIDSGLTDNNTVGGTTTGAGNLISGNAGAGVHFVAGHGNSIQGNLIGTDITGTAALGNAVGVQVDASAILTTIGGVGVGNLISGNTGFGIVIASSNIHILGNSIGTDATGTVPLGNRLAGILLVEGASDNTIGGTAPGAGNLISGNSGSGIAIDSGSGLDTVVQGNFIGTDRSGTRALGNGRDGVEVISGSIIHINGLQAPNLISGNALDGIFLGSSAGTNVTVAGGLIGTDITGTKALPNGNNGVSVFASNTTIGGMGANSRNLISGNTMDGVLVWGNRNSVAGNYIGTDSTGTAALGNQTGVLVSGSGNTIGGIAAGTGNLISGNGQDGLLLGILASQDQVQGNQIGTDITGTMSLPNGNYGVEMRGSSANTIGGSVSGAGNLISGNQMGGIAIGPDTFNDSSNSNLIQGNAIGTDVTGTGALPNGGNGIYVNGSDNTIGGTADGAGNLIAFSGNDGVLVDGGVGDAIFGNSIHSSTNLGIELINGGNNNQSFPVLTLAVSDGSSLTLQGSLSGAPSTTYTLQFFANSVCNPSGFGEGERLLGSLPVTTDGSGMADFMATFVIAVPVGQFLSATATDPGNNTSQFAQCGQVTAPQGPGGSGIAPRWMSLRERLFVEVDYHMATSPTLPSEWFPTQPPLPLSALALPPTERGSDLFFLILGQNRRKSTEPEPLWMARVGEQEALAPLMTR
jgi:hypothetical protein